MIATASSDQPPAKHSVAIVGFEFGGNAFRSNDDLAEIIAGNMNWAGARPLVVVQAPLDYTVMDRGIEPDYVVRSAKYIDSREVVRQVLPFLHEHGVQTVIVVAKPHLHLWYCRRLMRQAGFQTPKAYLLRVRYDSLSPYWWCRSTWRLYAYLLLRPLLKYRR